MGEKWEKVQCGGLALAVLRLYLIYILVKHAFCRYYLLYNKSSQICHPLALAMGTDQDVFFCSLTGLYGAKNGL
jgi:hypothetical protein